MFGMMEGASVELDLDESLTEETKNFARASIRAQLESKGVARERIEEAVAKLDALFANWTPAEFFATRLEQMGDMVGSRLAFAQGCKEAIDDTARGISERGVAGDLTIFKMGRISACMITAAMMMDVAATCMRELAAKVRDEKPEAVGEA